MDSHTHTRRRQQLELDSDTLKQTNKTANDGKRFLHCLIVQIKRFRLVIISAISVFILCSLFSSSPSLDPQFAAMQLFSNGYNRSDNTTSIFSSFFNRPPRLNLKNANSIEKRLNYYFPFEEESDVENNIWQLWKYKADSVEFPSKCFPYMERWRLANPEYNHNLLTFDEAQQQIYDHFIYDMPEIIDAYLKLPDVRLKLDFLKYLIIFTNGGVYADIDTLNAKPLRFWYKSTLKSNKMLVGVNVDYNDANWDVLYNRRLTFNSKIFKAKSHHPFFAKLISKIVYLSLNNQSEISKINWKDVYKNVDSNGEPLIQFTSESIFTDTLFEYFNLLEKPVVHRVARTDKDLVPEQIFGPETDEVFSYKLFTLSKGPTQVDDVVVMPQITFKGYQSISKDGAPDLYDGDEFDNENNKHPYYYARSLQYLNYDSLADN